MKVLQQWFGRFYWGTIVRSALDRQSRSILDLGCGDGGPMMLLNRSRQMYSVGADAFRPVLKECKATGAHEDIVLCDVRNLPFREKCFDAVLCFEVLEHLTKEEGFRLIEAMEGIARKRVVFSTPVGLTSQDEIAGNPYQVHRSGWTTKELRRLGYKVRGVNWSPRLIVNRGLLTHFAPLRIALKIVALPFVYFFPVLAERQICSKRFSSRQKGEGK